MQWSHRVRVTGPAGRAADGTRRAVHGISATPPRPRGRGRPRAAEGTQFLTPVTLTIEPPRASSTSVAITLVTGDDIQALRDHLTSPPTILDLQAFVDPLAQAAAIARAYPFVLQYAIDPQAEGRHW